MNVSWVTVVITGAVLWVLIFVMPRFFRRTETDPESPVIQETALRLYEELAITFQSRHAYRKVDAANFPHVNQTFYKRTQRALENAGFYFVADMENVTLSQLHPNTRTFLRAMIHEGGHVNAAVYNIRPTGIYRAMAWFRMVPRDVSVVEFESELSDGHFLVTTNASEDKLDPEPGMLVKTVHEETPVAEIFDRHRRALERYLSENPGVEPVRFSDYDDVLQSQHRQQELKCEYRRSIGYITEDEMLRIAGKSKTEYAKTLLEAIRRIQQEEARDTVA